MVTNSHITINYFEKSEKTNRILNTTRKFVFQYL